MENLHSWAMPGKDKRPCPRAGTESHERGRGALVRDVKGMGDSRRVRPEIYRRVLAPGKKGCNPWKRTNRPHDRDGKGYRPILQLQHAGLRFALARNHPVARRFPASAKRKVR